MMIQNKYNMRVEDNIFVAKRNIVSYIYESAKLEGLSVTFPDTDAIFYGGTVRAGLSVDEVVAVNNLKHAWAFSLDAIAYPTDYALICQLNRAVGANLFHNAGFIRTIPVRIGGTEWKPQLPIEADIKDELYEILSVDNATDRSISLMLYLMRRQMFIDGNKRTAMLAANHEMIKNGAGVISIPEAMQSVFREKLVHFYESGDMQDIKECVFESCIDGMDMELERAVPRESCPSDISFDKWIEKANGNTYDRQKYLESAARFILTNNSVETFYMVFSDLTDDEVQMAHDLAGQMKERQSAETLGQDTLEEREPD